MMGGLFAPTKRAIDPTCECAIVASVILSLAIMFLFGIANFAVHCAVLDCGHPLTKEMPELAQKLGGRLTLPIEYIVLLFAMLIAANGWPGAVWAYGVYTALNAVSAWLILSKRV